MSAFDEVGSSSSSPSKVALDLHPHLTSIDIISSDHGLSHDSGVSFGMSSRKREAMQQETLSDSSSSSSIKLLHTITDEARQEHRVMESPTPTSAFDARENVWRDVARKVKPFGDALRHERLRTPLGQSSLSDNCLDILNYSCKSDSFTMAQNEAQIELLRTLANLCIDHDDNRTLLLEKQGPQTVIRLLQFILASEVKSFSSTVITLLRIATGALLNMQLDHADTRLALRKDTNAMETLMQLATDERIYSVGQWYTAEGTMEEETKAMVSTGASIASWGWRVVQDVCAVDAKEQESSDGVTKKDEEETEKAIDGIISLGAAKAAEYLIKPLRPFLWTDIDTSKGPWNADDVSDLMESDMDVVQIVTELLEACSLDSKKFRLASLQSSLDFLMQFLDQAEAPKAWTLEREDTDTLPPKPSDAEAAKEVYLNFSRAKGAVAKAIVVIAGEDENMSLLFEASGNHFMKTLKDWMGRDATKRDDLVSTAMLAMGNLARKDSHCLALVHNHGLVPILSALLTPNADIKVAHGIVCLLKNLSIPSDNKLPIGNEHKLMPLLSPYLSASLDKVQPLQFATVGLLKHLCAGCVENSLDLVNGGDTLDVLLQLLQRTEDVPTRMEGTRVLVNVAKTLWTGSQDQQRLQARQKLVTDTVVVALAEMVRSSPKYPVLVNEGILALTLLASERDRHGAQLVASALVSDPAMEELNAMATRAEAPEDDETPTPLSNSNISKPQASSSSSLKGLAKKDKAPSRKTTMDSLASQTSQPLSPPKTSAEMISTVLSRRDARMPPQFASNACVFVQTLIDGSRSTPTITKAPSLTINGANNSDDGAIRKVLLSWIRALTRLSEVGPQETISLAKQTLQSTNEFLAA